MAVGFDEVGCNLSQETDKHNSREKHLCALDDEPCHTLSSRHHHFTCMGLTRLDGDPLMFAVIIAGKKQDVMIQTGIEWDELEKVPENIEEIEDEVKFSKRIMERGGCFLEDHLVGIRE